MYQCRVQRCDILLSGCGERMHALNVGRGWPCGTRSDIERLQGTLAPRMVWGTSLKRSPGRPAREGSCGGACSTRWDAQA